MLWQRRTRWAEVILGNSCLPWKCLRATMIIAVISLSDFFPWCSIKY